MSMRFGKVLGVAFVGLGCALAAQAQLGLYGTYTGTRLSGITCYQPAPTQCSSTGGVVNPSGVTGGLYYDFKDFGPIRLGGDLRGGVQRSNKSATTSAGGDNATEADSVLVGVRGTLRLPLPWIKPYAQVSGGWARSDATEQLHTYDNFAMYEGFLGADIKILPFLDLRAPELGIGNMNRFGTGSGVSSVGVKTIAVGIVVHLP